MNIKALRAFRATLSEGTLAAAANILNLSQSAVSRLISSLEGELRITLFDRTGRNLTPTPEGLAFYRDAGRILDNLDEIPRIAAEIRVGRSETLRIVAMPRIAASLVSPAVAKFLASNAAATVSLDVRARREAGKWLAGRQYDIGIGALPVDHPEIRSELLLRVRAQVVVHVDHPLAIKKEISAQDLAGEPIIRLMQGLLLREQLDDIFQSAGITPRHVCEVASSQLACSLVSNGAGITIADEIVAAQVVSKTVKLIPVVPERWMSFGMLYSKNMSQSKSCSLFVDVLRERIQSLAAQSRFIQVQK